MYRENIYEVIEATGEKIGTLVMPKNSGLRNYTWKVLKGAGMDLESAQQVDTGTFKVNGFTLLLRRGEDIPRIVVDKYQRGEVVLGLTGDDIYDEFRLRNPDNPLQVENTYDWFDENARFFRPTMCLLGKTGVIELLPEIVRVSVNSKYELTGKAFLEKSPILNGRPVLTRTYEGNLEDTVADGSYDCCIDMVYSGKSMDTLGLQMMQKIRFSDLVVISALKKDETLIGRVLNEEFRQIVERRERPTNSLTSKLIQDPELAARKANEEMYELLQASFGKGDVVAETADVFYALSVLLVQGGISLDDIGKEMKRRQK